VGTLCSTCLRNKKKHCNKTHHETYVPNQQRYSNVALMCVPTFQLDLWKLIFCIWENKKQVLK
jgi:hypothetical protein